MSELLWANYHGLIQPSSLSSDQNAEKNEELPINHHKNLCEQTSKIKGNKGFLNTVQMVTYTQINLTIKKSTICRCDFLLEKGKFMDQFAMQ